MIFHTVHGLEPAPSHERWLHDLRNVVSTASVATSVGRRLVADDAASAAEMLNEAEQALARCRELLAAAGDHVRDDGGFAAEAAAKLPSTGARERGGDRR